VPGTVGSIGSNAATPPADRVGERRRAVALARHFREAEGLSIAQIADRLGRSPATVKAYFYDPRMLTKDLRMASARRAPRAAPPGAQARLGPRRGRALAAWRGSAALCPIPAGARAYAGGATCARTGHGTSASLRYGTPRPTAPPVGWCHRGRGRSGVPARRGAPAGRRRAGSARDTHASVSSRAERLRLCESHKSADRSQSPTSSSGRTDRSGQAERWLEPSRTPPCAAGGAILPAQSRHACTRDALSRPPSRKRSDRKWPSHADPARRPGHPLLLLRETSREG
jgi:hypothetical protein